MDDLVYVLGKDASSTTFFYEQTYDKTLYHTKSNSHLFGIRRGIVPVEHHELLQVVAQTRI